MFSECSTLYPTLFSFVSHGILACGEAHFIMPPPSPSSRSVLRNGTTTTDDPILSLQQTRARSPFFISSPLHIFCCWTSDRIPLPGHRRSWVKERTLVREEQETCPTYFLGCQMDVGKDKRCSREWLEGRYR